jgi:hypothetical protein
MSLQASLFGSLRSRLDGLPDQRRGLNTIYPIGNIGMSAFSVFFMQSPSFLAHQKLLEQGYGRSNLKSLFGVDKAPSDNHIRAMLDPAEPQLLFPEFSGSLFRLAQLPDGLKPFRQPGLGDRVLIALDGTEYFRSYNNSCQCCSTRLRGKDGKDGKEYFHAMLAAAMVAPGHNKIIPLEPEFISPQDGAEKQDCETVAAKRWLAAYGSVYAGLDPIYLGDDLFSRQPMCEAVLAINGHFIFVAKPSSHPLIEEYIAGVELETRQETVKRGKERLTYCYRWIHEVPLRDSKDALLVNWFEIKILNSTGEITYRNSFITNLAIGPNNVALLTSGGRTRWKIENEAFNVLKTKGYNLEHNFGHGKQHLASFLVTLNLLAFTFHTILDTADELWKAARQKASARVRFFNNLIAMTTYVIFSSWQELLETLAFMRPPPLPP